MYIQWTVGFVIVVLLMNHACVMGGFVKAEDVAKIKNDPLANVRLKLTEQLQQAKQAGNTQLSESLQKKLINLETKIKDEEEKVSLTV